MATIRLLAHVGHAPTLNLVIAHDSCQAGRTRRYTALLYCILSHYRAMGHAIPDNHQRLWQDQRNLVYTLYHLPGHVVRDQQRASV